MVKTQSAITHQQPNGDEWVGLYVQHHVGSFTFDTFLGHPVAGSRADYDGKALLATWVWDGDELLSEHEELL